MENQKVHEYSIETGANGLPVARLGRVHNLITFITAGSPKLHFYDGRWLDDGGHEVPDENIPPAARQAAESIPFDGRLDKSPDVLIQCEFCPDDMPSRQYAKHLADKHIRSRATAADPATIVEAAPVQPRLRLEDLPEGSYLTDDDGFVILNVDGSPRKKAGRPRKE
jgi:hypothetical protein